MSCRLPRAPDPDQFWDLLRRGSCTVTRAPADRWLGPVSAMDDPAWSAIRHGAFLDRLDEFDADFFGISPGEAAAMDPQQRLILELVWEALEDAGIVPASLAGSRTGVFVGVIANDYATLLMSRGPEAIGPHAVTGLHRSLIANRVSFTWNLCGPSLTVDTGQSSSAVAVHLACESIAAGECDLAVVGGVNLNLVPSSAIAVERFGVLSPDGVCRVFDARANGYVRGEGGGVVILKPLSRAVADGDDVVCMIRGSAVNNDGGGGRGLTVPDVRAQEAVVRLACERAGVQRAAIQYVELHGTGTRTGDPVEAAALGAALGAAPRRRAAVLVGSAKTNIGHLEGAAGIAGLLKTALCIRHRQIPPSLHFRTPHPLIPLTELNLRVQTELGPWSQPDRPLLAGVSSFGMGGTNCHVVLGEAAAAAGPPNVRPSAAHRRAGHQRTIAWPVSARDEAALVGQARRLHDRLTGRRDVDLDDIALSLATTRTAFEHRAVLLARTRTGFRQALSSLGCNGREPAVVRGVAADTGRTVMLFPGDGPIAVKPVRDLLDASDTFLDLMRACSDAIAECAGWSVLDAVRGAPGAPPVDRPDVAEPMRFAVMVALAGLWRYAGVQPDAVLGLGVGEVTAGHVAGTVSLEAAARIAVQRGRIAVQRGRIGAGERAGSTGFTIDPSEFSVGEAAFYTTATAAPTDPVGTAADYWLGDHDPSGNGLERTMHALLRAGHRTFVEVSAEPVLVELVRATLDAESAANVVVGTLTATDRGWDGFLRALAHLHVRAASVAWPASVCEPRARRIHLPTYAFQRRRFWLDDPTLDATDPAKTSERSDAIGAPSWSGDSVHDLVRAGMAAALGYDAPGRVDTTRTFHDLGFDSVSSVELRDYLARATGIALAAGLVFDYPTPAALATHLHALLHGRQDTSAIGVGTTIDLAATRSNPFVSRPHRPRRSRPQPEPDRAGWLVRELADGDPVVVVGVGCRFPGGIGSAEQLWELVVAGREVISGFPTDRGWPAPDPAQAGDYARVGGFLSDPAGFDAAFFAISPREALAMDPHQRILLEIAWEALERAHINPTTLRGSPTGVFIGLTPQPYGPAPHHAPHDLQGYLLTGTTPSIASGRLAYTLGLHGPALTIDTACSSSLVATHLACQALRHHECDLALAGGATIMTTPDIYTEFHRQGGLAPDGRCKPFSAHANGTGWSEGAAILILERLTDAHRNHHPILATIPGSAINHDGASNGLTAPNGTAQHRVIHQALTNAHLTPNDIDAIEAHGTGTQLGDPIEAHALTTAYTPRNRPLYLGSIKSNLGHTQAAAGTAGLIKMLMAIHHHLLPQTLHTQPPTPHIDWTTTPLTLLTHNTPWPTTNHPHRAAISSFGISGTNAHLILEQPPTPSPKPTAKTHSFRRQRYWLSTTARPDQHPIAGSRIALADPAQRWFSHTLSGADPWFIAEHCLHGIPVLPASGMIEWALAVARLSADDDVHPSSWTLAGVSFNEVLRLPAGASVTVQAVVEQLGEAGGRRCRIRCFALSPGSGWTEHATVANASAGPPAGSRRVEVDAIARDMAEQDVDALYERLRRRGLEHGPALRGMQRLVRRGREAVAWVDLTGVGDGEVYLVDPAVLDACLHPVTVFLEDDRLWLPIAVDRITVHERLTAQVVSHVIWHGVDAAEGGTADLSLRTTRGSLLATIEGLRLQPVGPNRSTSRSTRARGAAAAGPGRRLASNGRRDVPTVATQAVPRDTAAAHKTVAARLLDKLAELLHLPAADRDALRPTFPTVPLNRLGVDSLTIVQLRNWLLFDMGVDITPDVLLGGATGGEVAQLICQQLTLRQVIAGDETPAAGVALEVFRL